MSSACGVVLCRLDDHSGIDARCKARDGPAQPPEDRHIGQRRSDPEGRRQCRQDGAAHQYTAHYGATAFAETATCAAVALVMVTYLLDCACLCFAIRSILAMASSALRLPPPVTL